MNKAIETSVPGYPPTQVNGFTVVVDIWSGNLRPFRGIVLDSEGNTVAHTGGFKSPHRAQGKAFDLARGL